MITILLIALFSTGTALYACDALEQEAAFITSFVNYYDCSQEGRYTHEYHPYLLESTKASLQELESFLMHEGFFCPHRLVIMGYQEEGVAPFLPMPLGALLDDEYVHQSSKGRVVPAHNVFGFLTGFLLKDSNWMQQQWGMQEPGLVQHHLPERIPLFNDYAYLFQKTAFGTDSDLIFAYRDRVERLLKKQEAKLVLQELANFWNSAYQGELKSFSHQVLATQDILFSIAYARHLCTSAIPVRTIFTGPDITYPIELLPCQEQKATESAQKFVDYFGSKLVPVAGKKTAYIFCSFVDGVGKSTLLGNVINWKKYGAALEKYERVDNSSSQRATLYQVDDQVAILDLPAQLSHFVSKPDGYVFVPLEVAQQQHVQKELDAYVARCGDRLLEQYQQALTAPSEAPASTLYDEYVAVVKLFGKQDEWVPFMFDTSTYLFKQQDRTTIHVAVPLEGVQSRGLKVAHPTHMLFTKGLSLPMHPQAFMRDCADMLHAAGIEQLVFVDFLSMYPRSSRENIRVNFLLQQLKKVYGSLFDYERSFYKTVVNGNAELFYDLQHQMPHFACALVMETVMRTALFTLFQTYTQNQVRTITPEQVTNLLQQACGQLLHRHNQTLTKLCQHKVFVEQQALQSVLRDKMYHQVVDFSFRPLIAFSQFMQDLWTNKMYHPLMSELWATCSKHAVPVAGIDAVARECRDPLVLAKIMPCLRSAWYVSLTNLVRAQVTPEGSYVCSDLMYPVTPVMVQPGANGMVHVVQYPLNPVARMPDLQTLRAFVDLQLPVGYEQDAWGTTHETLWMQPLSTTDTGSGLFGLGYTFMQCCIKDVVNAYRVQQSNKWGDQFMLTSQLVRELDEQHLWQKAVTLEGKQTPTGKKRTLSRDDPQREVVALMVRALATLEMIAKDPHVSILARRGAYEDFRAAVLLLERIVLPRYCNLYCDGPLFEDYATIEPVISWDVIASYQ